MKIKSKDLNYIGEKLKMYRAKNHLSQTKLSELSMINIAQISRYENNQAIPNADAIQRLSIALDISYLELAGNTKFDTVDYDKTLNETKLLPETDKLIIKEVMDKFIRSHKINKVLTDE